jgi:CDGSH-type Zn-finger protein
VPTEPNPADPADRPCRVVLEPGGPVLIEGPVEVLLGDGTVAVSHRVRVALCTCRRSRHYPWCDTSHRRRCAARAGEGPSE